MRIPNEFKYKHEDTLNLFKYFAYDHLPEPLLSVSRQSYELAYAMTFYLPDNQQLRLGLLNLLQAKDAFVRASLDMPKYPTVDPENAEGAQGEQHSEE
jgi:hypothetical protein